MKKKNVSVMILLSLCFFSTNAHAQFNIGNIVKDVVNTTTQKTEKQGSQSGNIISGLTSIFSADKVATIEDLVGTWSYVEPAVVLKSANVLKNAGGKLASSAVEKKLKTQLEKVGISKGLMGMTFAEDGSFTQIVKKKTLKGNFEIDGQNVVLKYAGQVKQMIGTTQVSGDDLLIVMDASKLLGYMKTIGALSGNANLKTATSLLGSMDGMQCGLRLKKQK